MRSAHTDAQLLLATQIAYLDINPGPGQPVNVKEWISSQKRELQGAGTAEAEKRMETIENIERMVQSEEFGDLGWENWTVVDSCNHNTSTGFYASVIDTGNGDAIVGFRGSESYDLHQGFSDWALADFGLLNQICTLQQAEAKTYISKVWDKYGDQYDSFDLCGHSLGGNLATHAIITAPAEMRDRIGRTVSFDGPGFSGEYIAAHRGQIDAVSEKIDHIQWSSVGGLLYPIPGSNVLVADAAGILLERHRTENLTIRNGSVVPGERDPLAVVLSGFSRWVETVTSPTPLVAMAVLLGIQSYGRELIHQGEEAVSSFLRQMFSAKAEFTVAPAQLYDGAEQLERFGAETRRIAEEVAALSEGIQYDTLAGHCIRRHFRRIARGIDHDGTGASDLGNALEQCAEIYQRCDGEASAALTL